MKKVDIHVHSKGSDTIVGSNKFTRNLGIRESYVDAEHQYQLAKRQGMDYVTLSDHDSISEAKKLVELHPEDTFISCEYRISGRPRGQDSEIVVLDVDEKMHEELMKVKCYGIKEFVKFVTEAKKPYTLAHPAWPVNPKGPKLTVKELEEWTDICTVLEGLNGDAMRENEVTQIIAKHKNKPMSGGSDDHNGLFTGSAYTIAPDAESKEGFLEQFLKGEIYAEGEFGTIEKAYRGMLKTGWDFYKTQKDKRRDMGWMNFYREGKRKFFMMFFMPPLLPFFIRATATRNKKTFERRTLALETKYLKYLKAKRNDILEERIEKLRRELDNELDELISMVKPESAYIGKESLFKRIISRVFDFEVVHTDFDRF